MPRVAWLVTLLVIVTSTVAQAQPWAGIIDPSRAIDWSKAGIPGGIPNRTTICATLNPGATAAQINNAIAACPSGQVVFLTAGTYNLSTGINFSNKSNVTLRGAGADQTKLVFTGSVGCQGPAADVCFRNSDTSYAGNASHTTNWTAGYSKGATQITVSSTAGMAVGNYLSLDQADDSNMDTETIWVCQTTACSDEGPGGSGAPGRIQAQKVNVTAINGNVVTISPGLYMPNWRPAQSPKAWGANTYIKMSGIEDMSLDHTASNAQSGIVLFNAYNCWVKGVRSVQADRNHVWGWETAAGIVRDSYFYGTKNAKSQSYGVELYHASDMLVENNIFQHIVAPLMVAGSASGSVYGYNYAIDDYYCPEQGNCGVTLMGQAWLHAGGQDNILFEGNDGPAWFSDDIHGTHHFVTAFRNRYSGFETGRLYQTQPVIIKAFGRYINLVGNVLGTASYHTTYQCGPTTCSNADHTIYELGTGSSAPSDSLVGTTLMRWGNYDVVNNAVRFMSGEVPSGLSLYANPVPQSQTLPVSFYLSARPSTWWATLWGTTPWPPIGPDVTSGNLANVGGHANKIPARLCYENTQRDGNGILVFNASRCYVPQSGPAPPTNLTVR